MGTVSKLAPRLSVEATSLRSVEARRGNLGGTTFAPELSLAERWLRSIHARRGVVDEVSSDG